MSYFDKYSKYKNKYLELKNVVGGEDKKEFSWGYLNNLWENGNENDFVKYPKSSVSLSSFSKFFKEYCWIGPPRNSFRAVRILNADL